MKVQILVENRASQPECLAEHGLSVFIESGERKILFDLGATEIYLQNAKRMKIDLEQVDTVVVSHGHYDHTGGIPSFCGINHKAKIYIHNQAFETFYGLEDGKLDDEPCSIRWSPEQRKAVADRLVLTDGATRISEDIIVSGTIPKGADFTPTERFFRKNEDGSLTADPMEHEQFLAVRVRDHNGQSQGYFVFSGCSHNGVIPCLSYAKALFPGEKILGLLAGMHLYHTDAATRKAVLEQIVAENMNYILPVHCTGIHAICDLKLMIGERCIPAGTGDRFEF
jgi:7,8-dihydropterin-6-yl-methyl-4-(beta-D-ribofuranosyl)aminobenzene 5'-phosphate synthase